MDMAAGELAKTRPKALSVPGKGRECTIFRFGILSAYLNGEQT
jgi:hypothetical protein